MYYFPNKMRGQVLPLSAVLFGIVALSIFLLYNSNIIVTERIRLQNTADAAAFSSATLDSRYLNFMAYSNRAMIADHVITAQMIGLAANGKMLKQTGSNIQTFLGWIPYYGYYIKILSYLLKYYSVGMDYVPNFSVPIANYTTKTISYSQQAFRIAIPAASVVMTQKIVEANDKDADVSTVLLSANAAEMINFLNVYSPKNADSDKDDKARSNEFYDVTMKSRNKFASARSGDWEWFKFEIPYLVEFYPVKYGGTDMSNGSAGPKKAEKYKTWAAMDTLSLQLRKFGCKNKLGLPIKWCGWAEIPIGYGSGVGGNKYNFSNDKSKSLYGNGAWNNKVGATLQTTMGENYQNSNNDGMQPFVDLKKQGRIDSSPAKMVALSKSEANIATNTTLGVAQGGVDIAAKGTLRKGKQFTLAKAASYFNRPQDIESSLHSTNKREFGNLYNPFWAPKLEKSSSAEAQAIHLIVVGN